MAVISLRPANEHRLKLQLEGRMPREFSREQVAELKAAIDDVPAAQARTLIAAFLPGFSFAEYLALSRAVDEFERLALIEAERENPRSWPNVERVAL